jgi:hypothetical protein
MVSSKIVDVGSYPSHVMMLWHYRILLSILNFYKHSIDLGRPIDELSRWNDNRWRRATRVAMMTISTTTNVALLHVI